MLGKLTNTFLRQFGLKLSPLGDRDIDLEDELFLQLCEKVRGFTMTSTSDLFALYNALNFITQHNIEGDLVECGVWKGGSAMFIAYYLVEREAYDRKIYLYDTFAGMTPPSALDIDLNGNHPTDDEVLNWQPASLYEVKANMEKTNFPMGSIVFAEGDVKDVLPTIQPEKIALLRLDTDWYASTLLELKHLYPNLSTNGVLILDDHGHWLGARQAAEEYFREIAA
ncbi:MAG: O-methyltransferase, partial [Cyclobacteriaceae bacterium]